MPLPPFSPAASQSPYALPRGNQLELRGRAQPPDDFTILPHWGDWAIDAKVRRVDIVSGQSCDVATLAAAWIDPDAGRFSLTSVLPTDKWPLGGLQLVITFLSPDAKQRSVQRTRFNVTENGQ